jgi:hypothetical protein
MSSTPTTRSCSELVRGKEKLGHLMALESASSFDLAFDPCFLFVAVVVLAELVSCALVLLMPEPMVMLEPVVVIAEPVAYPLLVVMLEPVVVIAEPVAYGLVVVMLELVVYALVLPPFCCAADDEGCSIKTCAIALRSGDAEGWGPSSKISRLCHRMVEPRQCFPSAVGMSIS